MNELFAGTLKTAAAAIAFEEGQEAAAAFARAKQREDEKLAKDIVSAIRISERKDICAFKIQRTWKRKHVLVASRAAAAAEAAAEAAIAEERGRENCRMLCSLSTTHLSSSAPSVVLPREQSSVTS